MLLVRWAVRCPHRARIRSLRPGKFDPIRCGAVGRGPYTARTWRVACGLRPSRCRRLDTAVREEGEDMSEQVRKSTSTKASGSDAEESSKAALQEKGRKLGKELDGLIDEIDGLLEENAKEFVDNYIQRGGQ